ncbi:uncharacterized oxidoreductase MexAM1_META1p0182-like isoform X3 [Haliotis rubra]|uniref:uncharacterized oxidoreductase MexAM1_META1p0182-like isoform X3 n=1 Tax=Haliotis rubra TaxID=36100 RepID=UPI001EE5369B|nr:uncharacterized oxidoreductase MexAM1_META1p0182-like isoform X3 [Haliotis rubra]
MALRGKVALITGSSSGIGAGIAAVFAREGAKLSLTGRNQKGLEGVVKKCKTEASNDVLTNVGDITQDAFRKTLVEATRKKFGKIDILVNNAGIEGASPLQSVTKELYDRIMAIHVETPVFLTQLVAPHLIESKGCVVNISTCGTSTIVPGVGIYVMSKAALDTFTRYLAHEMVSLGVRVNAVNPGYIPTQILSRNLSKEDLAKMESAATKATPVGRAGTAEEIGHIVAFLASEKAAFVTGECIRADGGSTMTTPVLT